MWNDKISKEKKQMLAEMAKPVISKEKHFDTKENAEKEALKQCRNLDSLISVWEAPDGRFAIIQHKNREKAGNCDYKEVIDTATLYDAVKARGGIDEIEEV